MLLAMIDPKIKIPEKAYQIEKCFGKNTNDNTIVRIFRAVDTATAPTAPPCFTSCKYAWTPQKVDAAAYITVAMKFFKLELKNIAIITVGSGDSKRNTTKATMEQ